MRKALTVIFLFASVNWAIGQISTCSSTGIWYTGDGTYYNGLAGSSNGHCSLAVPVGDIFHAAINSAQYDNSNPCGTCVRILGPSGEVTVKIVDECPSCAYGDLDLAMGAFPYIASTLTGRVKIKWQYVKCTLDSGITVLFDPTSNPYYFKAQFSNSLYPISTLEYRKQDGTYEPIPRVNYNYFVNHNGIDEVKTKYGPYIFRITSSTHQVVVTDSVHYSTGQPVQTGVQFNTLHCKDCAGILDGTALLDNCGACSGGTTGVALNSSCTRDCAGVWDGTAYLDGCGTCVSGTTGRTPCDKDCNNDLGGLAYLDKCGICVGGNTGKSSCEKDCNNHWGGSAIIDSCGKCAGGNTGLTPILQSSLCTLTSSFLESHSNTDFWLSNPFQDELSVHSKAPLERLKLFDILGAVLFETNSTVINTSSLPMGIYLIAIESQQIIVVQRVVKD